MTPSERLVALVVDANSLDGKDLKARLMWLEEAAAAADAAADDDEEARAAGLHLRAALGAIVKWSQGDKDPATLPQLDAIVRTLLARGLLGMTRLLAARFDALAQARAPHRVACIEARDTLLELARSIEKGTPPSTTLRARLARMQETPLS